MLLPHLAGALSRDNTAASRARSVTPGIPVNPEVLHAMVVLHREVPAVTMAACEATGEPWQPRPIPVCLTALPRLAQRLHDTGHPGDAMAVEGALRRWVRVTKQALGLRTPDLAIGAVCPVCGEGDLMAAGSEGFLRRTGHGATVEWEHPGRVYCGVCVASWGVGEWPHLGRLLEAG